MNVWIWEDLSSMKILESLPLAQCAILCHLKITNHFLHYTLQLPVLLFQFTHSLSYSLSHVAHCHFQEVVDPGGVGDAKSGLLLG